MLHVQALSLAELRERSSEKWREYPADVLPLFVAETDSGLDVDALKIVSEGVNRAKESTGLGVLLITHYTRILRYIRPDFVHVVVAGKIVEQGGPELADRLENEGYDRFLDPSAPIEA